MTAAEIRQSFLDFFREKQHTIVPSAPLLPQSPGLLFTNAGMNPFVPYFLGTEKAPYDPGRATDTQKCIRAGGKHNDLDDVGYDTYHHTFFEMLGNWSFGDYFKAEAIQWAWELVVERWGLPANRLYATVYAPDKAKGDPGEFDQEAWDLWAELFKGKGLDPRKHIVDGNVKDNFWMMGETGPCGPCSELHVDLTPNGDSNGQLVNGDSDLCIEIWNLVFIQYNAEADGSFRDLPAKHIDTGMGFERACSIIQNTKGFTDFSVKPSNYATDVFTPIFRKLEELSGKTYVNIYPELDADRSAFSEEMKVAIAFRVIADHLRTLSFSIADGILPGNNGRNYVLRRILRRAVRYGRELGFSGDKPFFGALVSTLVEQMGGVFPELKEREAAIRVTLEREEASFNETLDRGLVLFGAHYQHLQKRKIEVPRLLEICAKLRHAIQDGVASELILDLLQSMHASGVELYDHFNRYSTTRVQEAASRALSFSNDWQSVIKPPNSELLTGEPIERDRFESDLRTLESQLRRLNDSFYGIEGEVAFELYDTFGFPIDLTELLCADRAIKVNMQRFEELMEEQRERARAAQKTSVVRALDISTEAVTAFTGFDSDEADVLVLEVHPQDDSLFVITDKTPFYAEMGGQVGDTGILVKDALAHNVTAVQQIGRARAHAVPADADVKPGDTVKLRVDAKRRRPIEAHHTATHLLHWALHEVVSSDAAQQGSSVDEERLRFDFNSAPVTAEQIEAMEEKVNACITADEPVSWAEVPHAEIKERKDIMQFFGDKYGDTVRVVQIGGAPRELDGYSMELCGGTHVRKTGEIGLFKIRSEGAIASGVRRIEAVCGDSAWEHLQHMARDMDDETDTLQAKLAAANAKLDELGEEPVSVGDMPRIMTAMLVEKGDIRQINHTLGMLRSKLDELREAGIEAEKRVKKLQASAAAKQADAALALLIEQGGPIVTSIESDASLLQELLNGLKKKQFTDAAFVIVDDGDKLHLGAYCGEAAQARGLKAGDLLRELAALAGGKGGGKPDMARGAAPERDKLGEMEAAAKAKLA
ncbi:alanine--tRNA ligase/alanyl-tRNA synthetase [Haloferula helveola]|uniref:Alanine--tRNA ligase n=1 Tax=Haloferula helveola TaxID=490095 RepID=A0ABM7R9I5_9BACT|nr:alanine--tRNA ligase/alanyl-tRNA synthetase [Haloferula helveola]